MSIPRISLKKPLSKGTVHHQRLPSSLKKSATSSMKEMKHYTKLGNGIMTFYINAPPMTSITIRRNIESSSNSEGIAAIVNKLENLGRDTKKLKENVHAIQVRCQIYGGAHLDKDDPLNEEIKNFIILDMVEDIRMPIILERPLLATAHAKVDIFRKSISLEVGSEKVIFKMRSSFTTTNFESVRSIKSETFLEEDDLKKIDYDLFLYDSESCEFNRLLRIDLDIFSYEVDIHESYEEIVYKLTEVEKEKYPAPQEKRVHWCREILQERRISASIGHLVIPIATYVMEEIYQLTYGKVCKMTRERILKDYWRERFRDEEDDLEQNLEDLEECGEDKANTILGVIHDKLNNDWFNNTSEDEDDLEGILDYLKPRSYDGFIDLDDEAYNKRRCRLLGMTYGEPTSIIIKKAKVTRYTVGPDETYTKVELLGVEKIPRIKDNVAAIRAGLLKILAQKGNG
ncbi:hypothetical protein Tco_0098219 [Tanacetum coccineum]